MSINNLETDIPNVNGWVYTDGTFSQDQINTFNSDVNGMRRALARETDRDLTGRLDGKPTAPIELLRLAGAVASLADDEELEYMLEHHQLNTTNRKTFN